MEEKKIMDPDARPRIYQAKSDQDWERARDLFREYAESLGFDLEFQDFETELADLRSQYAPPAGCLLLVEVRGRVAGCAGVRRSAGDICEMKRMYLEPAARGRGTGRTLAKEAIRAARNLGYRRMRLDTLGRMTAANSLYRFLGFAPIEPYRHNPIEDAVFLEMELDEPDEGGGYR